MIYIYYGWHFPDLYIKRINERIRDQILINCPDQRWRSVNGFEFTLNFDYIYKVPGECVWIFYLQSTVFWVIYSFLAYHTSVQLYTCEALSYTLPYTRRWVAPSLIPLVLGDIFRIIWLSCLGLWTMKTGVLCHLSTQIKSHPVNDSLQLRIPGGMAVGRITQVYRVPRF